MSTPTRQGDTRQLYQAKLHVLRAGGSNWPEKTLAPLGGDLTDPHFWQEGLGEIEKMVAQAEGLVKGAK